MPQIIVQDAEVMQVTVFEKKDKESGKIAATYYNVHIYSATDRNPFFNCNIRHRDDDAKEFDRKMKLLDHITRAEPRALVLDCFEWDGKKNYTFLGTIEEMATGKKWQPVSTVSKAANADV